MKIYALEVVTDSGRRTVQLSVPLEIDPFAAADMPPIFRSLTELLWRIVRDVSSSDVKPPKAEA